MSLKDKVHLLGLRDDVYPLMKSCDLFMLLSNWEAFGIVVIEAMACGLPVIGSDLEGIKEIITSGKDGILVKPTEYKKISDMILELSQCSSLKKLSSEARKRVVSTFDIHNIIRAYERLYTVK